MDARRTNPATATLPPLTEAQRSRAHRHTLLIVVLSQVLSGAGLAAGLAVGSLLAQDMLGTDALAGVPTGLFTFGSALAAYLIGRATARFGRRHGLTWGFTVGGLGAVGVLAASSWHNVPLLFFSLLVYGAGTATNLQARYAGTDLALPHRRGFGSSVAMVATTVGAIVGPNLVEPLGSMAESVAVPALAGPFLLSAAAYLSAALVLGLFLRPDPFFLAQRLPQHATSTSDDITPSPAASAGSLQRLVTVGAGVMALSQIVMVAVMNMVPLHLRNNGHDLGAVGLVISLHIGAMWLPSLLTGVLVDRIGRVPVIVAAGITLIVSCVLAAVAPVDSLALITVAMVLLGLGWNFGMVSGTAMVVDGAVAHRRALIQGKTDVLIALSGGASGVLSGVIMAGFSYATLSFLGAALALVLIPLALAAHAAFTR